MNVSPNRIRNSVILRTRVGVIEEATNCERRKRKVRQLSSPSNSHFSPPLSRLPVYACYACAQPKTVPLCITCRILACSADLFWPANAQYFFAKCVAAILDSQRRGRLGRDTNFYQGGGP